MTQTPPPADFISPCRTCGTNICLTCEGCPNPECPACRCPGYHDEPGVEPEWLAEKRAEEATERYFEERNWAGYGPGEEEADRDYEDLMARMPAAPEPEPEPEPGTCQGNNHLALTDEQTTDLGRWASTAKPGDIFTCPNCGKALRMLVSSLPF